MIHRTAYPMRCCVSKSNPAVPSSYGKNNLHKPKVAVGCEPRSEIRSPQVRELSFTPGYLLQCRNHRPKTSVPSSNHAVLAFESKAILCNWRLLRRCQAADIRCPSMTWNARCLRRKHHRPKHLLHGRWRHLRVPTTTDCKRVYLRQGQISSRKSIHRSTLTRAFLRETILSSVRQPRLSPRARDWRPTRVFEWRAYRLGAQSTLEHASPLAEFWTFLG